MNPPELLENILDLARDAGQAAMTIYNKDFAVEYKDDKSKHW